MGVSDGEGKAPSGGRMEHSRSTLRDVPASGSTLDRVAGDLPDRSGSLRGSRFLPSTSLEQT